MSKIQIQMRLPIQQQYFVKVKIADYANKNKLYTDLKKAIKKFDNTLVSADQVENLILVVKEVWQQAHDQNKRCKPLRIEERSRYLTEGIDPNEATTKVWGNYVIGNVHIYPIKQEVVDVS